MSEEIVEPDSVGAGKTYGQEPVQRVEAGPPTHACFHPDGSTTVVYPEGHDPATLVKLPRGYSAETHEPHHASRSFVKRAVPSPTDEPDLSERVRQLEEQIGHLMKGTN